MVPASPTPVAEGLGSAMMLHFSSAFGITSPMHTPNHHGVAPALRLRGLSSSIFVVKIQGVMRCLLPGV